jgi:ABC-2 type transport system ATP-binding protein
MRPYFHVHAGEASLAQVRPVSVAAGAPPTLQAQAVTRRFGERVAVREASFEVSAGERLAIIGPNGAGKTTLLSMLAGVLAPSGGRVGGTAGRTGWVPQQPAIYSKLSVAENLRLFARLERLADPEAAVARMLEQTGLAERADEQVSRLSGGNQQRLNIAIGLLNQPPVLLLDEPSSALDPRQRERLWEFIVGLSREGTSVIYSTHNVLEAERYADRVLVLGDGETLFLGPPGQLAATVGDHRAPDFEAAFVSFLRARGH